MLVSLLLFAGCTLQPHHAGVDPALEKRLTEALYQIMRQQNRNPDKLPPTSKRRLRQRIGRLTAHAQDDHAAIQALKDGRLSMERIHRHSVDMIIQTNERRHGQDPEPVHAWLMAKAPDWNEDEALLVRLLTRELIITYGLNEPGDWEMQ